MLYRLFNLHIKTDIAILKEIHNHPNVYGFESQSFIAFLIILIATSLITYVFAMFYGLIVGLLTMLSIFVFFAYSIMYFEAKVTIKDERNKTLSKGLSSSRKEKL